MKASVDEEAALIARAQGGDREAFSRLFGAHKDRVYSLALRLSGNPEDASDILQEVFLRVYRGLGTFRQESAFSTWLYRLAVNASRTWLSKKQRHQSRETSLEEEIAAAPAPRQATSDPVARKHLLAALEQLPPRYREVLVLHDVKGLQHKEIAAILGVQVGTSKSQLHKARKYMRSQLKGLQP